MNKRNSHYQDQYQSSEPVPVSGPVNGTRFYILSILFLVIAANCFAQNSQTKYYNNAWLEKEMPEEKAKFSQTIINNADGTVTKEVRNIKSGEIIGSTTFKGNEPYGIWPYKTSKGASSLDYNFPLKYADEKCTDSISSVKITDYFEDNDSLNYKSPRISTGEPTIYDFIARHLVYPSGAREENIQGRVYVVFTVTNEGNIENIFVKKGTNILLDKESVRVLRQIKFSGPATLNGQPQSFCVTLPISFKLS